MPERGCAMPKKFLLLLVLTIGLAGCSTLPSATVPTSPVTSQLTSTLAAAPLASETARPLPSSSPVITAEPALPAPPPPPTALSTSTPNPTFVRMVDHWPVKAASPLAWSPDGRSFLLGTADYELVRYPLDGGGPVTLLAVPEGDRSFDQIRATWDPRADAIVTPRGEPDGSFAIVALSPDGVELHRFVSGVASDSWWGSMRPNLLEEANRAPLSSGAALAVAWCLPLVLPAFHSLPAWTFRRLCWARQHVVSAGPGLQRH